MRYVILDDAGRWESGRTVDDEEGPVDLLPDGEGVLPEHVVSDGTVARLAALAWLLAGGSDAETAGAVLDSTGIYRDRDGFTRAVATIKLGD